MDGVSSYELGGFDPADGLIFADGSAFNGKYADLSAAGTAIVQVNDERQVVRSVHLPLPLDMEQSAAAAAVGRYRCSLARTLENHIL